MTRDYLAEARALALGPNGNGKSKLRATLPPDRLPGGEPVAGRISPADDVVHIGELLAEPDTAERWTIDGLLPTGGLGILAGKPKGGKSTLARAMCLRTARGETVLGRATLKGPVLYCGLEDSRRVIREHFRRMGAVATDDLFIFPGQRPTDAMLWLEEHLNGLDPVLACIDTMQFMLGIRDMNDYSTTVDALRPVLDLLRPRRTAGLLIHHAGKGDRVGFDAILGSTGILGTVDTALLIRRRDDDTRTLASLQRSGDDLPESVLTLSAAGEPQLAGTRADYDLHKMGEAIKAYVDTRPEWLERSALLEALEGKAELKVKALAELCRSGELERKGEGKKGDPYLFRKGVFRSPTTVGTAERNPVSVDNPHGNASYSVPVFPGVSQNGPLQGTAFPAALPAMPGELGPDD